MTSPNPPQYRVVATLSSTKRPAHTYRDEEFGDIHYRRIARSRHVRVRLSTDGRLQASLPVFAPLSSLAQLIDQSRSELRQLTTRTPASTYTDSSQIGHSHTLHFITNRSGVLRGSIGNQRITISYPSDADVESRRVQELAREYVARALRKESKAYLPRRLEYLAAQGRFAYSRVRFAHQSGRWGSCSSSGTISLNIALMNLPFELIDYVLTHELAHTAQMNHSPAFWELVERYYPDYKQARAQLKTHSPYL